MRFWDSSAIVPLLVKQATTAKQTELLGADKRMVVWWMTDSECFSALSRLERENLLTPESFGVASERLAALASSWITVTPIDALKQEVRRILRLHPLRCADAYQLAAAILASEKNPASLTIITLDDRLALAASKEGFTVL